MSYYPNVLFFRAEELSDIDTFINDNKTKFQCTLNIMNDTNDLYKLTYVHMNSITMPSLTRGSRDY